MSSLRVVSNGGYGIIAFEFVWIGNEADFIMNIWQQAAVDQEIVITYWDYAYLVAYGSMALGLLLLVTQGLKDNEKMQKIYLFLCLCPPISALCDAIENANLLIMLGNYPTPASDINAFLASLFATIKFSLLGVSLLVYLIALLYLLMKKTKK
ncbi:MAG: hypothetical protein GY870_07555 [archaeon]|nr:hypothetical protein [archaeon]